jgi:protease secretion system membrane fusion protein
MKNLPIATPGVNSPAALTNPLGGKTVEINDAVPQRWGWLVLLVGFGGFALWATLAPLDQGVSAPGVVIVSGSRKAVQPLTAGKIAALQAKDGDTVTAGQVLVRLDDTQAKSQYEIARSQWFSALAVEARLMAERAGKSKVTFPPALLNERSDPAAAKAIELQTQLFETRRNNLESGLAILRENVTGLEAQVRGLEESRKAKEDQVRLLHEELTGQRELTQEGYLPRNKLLEQERLLAQLSGAISDDIGNIGRTRSSIAETKKRMISHQQEYQREVESALTDSQRDAASLASRVDGLAFELANATIRSPSEGVVVGLAVHTVGGVVQAGMNLMDVVPKDEPLKIDTQIPTFLIDKVKVDLPVDIMFPAFQQATTPHVPGTVLTVSADILTDPKDGHPFYKAQIQVTPEGMRKLREHKIKAGMPAEVFIRTGERTMLNYIIKPLGDRLRSSLTEE